MMSCRSADAAATGSLYTLRIWYMTWKNDDRTGSSRTKVASWARTASRSRGRRISTTSSRSSRSIHSAAAVIDRPDDAAASR
jgi:hypothetical protein